MEKLRSIGRKLEKAALSVLNARYSLSAWLWVIASLITSIILTNQVFTLTTPGLVEFDEALPINIIVWVIGLLVSELVTIAGMAFRNKRIVRFGAIPAFLLWTTGAIGFLLVGQTITLAIIIIPFIIFHAHICVASLLRDRPQI